MLSKDDMKLLDDMLFRLEITEENEVRLYSKIRKLNERIKLVEQITEVDKAIDELDKPVEKYII